MGKHFAGRQFIGRLCFLSRLLATERVIAGPTTATRRPLCCFLSNSALARQGEKSALSAEDRVFSALTRISNSHIKQPSVVSSLRDHAKEKRLLAHLRVAMAIDRPCARSIRTGNNRGSCPFDCRRLDCRQKSKLPL